MCHFLVKAIVFFELGKAISFSILFTFWISAMRLFIFKNFFSLDLYIYNLNINKMWLLRHLLFQKWSHCLCNQETRKWQSVVLKLVKSSYFESTELNQTISISHDHFHKTYDKVFCRINYKNNTEEMALFQKNKVFCWEIRHCLRFYIEGSHISIISN